MASGRGPFRGGGSALPGARRGVHRLSKSESRLLYDRYGYRGRGNQGFDEALWEGREQVERGENVHLALELKSYQADRGTRRLVEYTAQARLSELPRQHIDVSVLAAPRDRRAIRYFALTLLLVAVATLAIYIVTH